MAVCSVFAISARSGRGSRCVASWSVPRLFFD